MNRRTLFRMLTVAPIAAAVAVAPAKTIWARLSLSVGRWAGRLEPASVSIVPDTFEAAFEKTIRLVAQGTGVPRHILTGTIDEATTRAAAKAMADSVDAKMKEALFAEAQDIMRRSKARLPVLPPAHPNCRCVIVPEGAYAEIHEPLDDDDIDDYVVGIRRHDPITFTVDWVDNSVTFDKEIT